MLFRLRSYGLAMRTLVTNRQTHVLRFPGQRRDREANSIGAVLLNQLQRINAVAFGLGHCLAKSIQNLRMDVDMLKRHVTHVVEPREHHSRNPQRDNVAGGNEDRAGVEEVEDFVPACRHFRFQI